MKKVQAYLDNINIPTYGLGKPMKHPIFLSKRVYQGSCGKVYPVPFIDKVFQDEPPKPVSYQSAHLENEYVRLVMLPEIGGRIFIGQDKSNNDYDFFYRQDVIKPALVALAGPWISGGVEFNWPQHHRPGTYMPSDVYIEEESDGVCTVWQSEHDPLNRLKGMHGIRLKPNSCLIELKGQLFNRNPITHTFLWWANVAARVHDNYQSFFPPDVHYVADHAVRAMSSFPIAENDYYGMDYANRPDANNLSWYKNIPVPTSYMVCQTEFDFFGGYDYDSQGGFIHVANKHIAPGKKQWTWGNDEFGWAWDRELTDENGPYIELMAGIYTDNQPDFTYLLPYETKTFSQFWWPYKKLGPVQNANEKAAIRLIVNRDRTIDTGVAVSEPIAKAHIILKSGVNILIDEYTDISPDTPWQNNTILFKGDNQTQLELMVVDDCGCEIIRYRPVKIDTTQRRRQIATEPEKPEDIASPDELYLTGEHLELYRHPTRYPEEYWNEALKRDPSDARSNIAMGKLMIGRGDFETAKQYLTTAIKRLTFRHPNPETGQGHYYLGLAERYSGSYDNAYTHFYKATWNYEWRAAGYYELACLDCIKSDYRQALKHLDCALDTNRLNNKAYILKSIILRKTGRNDIAKSVINEVIERDKLDHWARFEAAFADSNNNFSEALLLCKNDGQTIIDIAMDYAGAGFHSEAAAILELHHKNEVLPVSVPNPLSKNIMTHYCLAYCYAKMDKQPAAMLQTARSMAADFCFPSRLEEYVILRWAIEMPGDDCNAAYGLGNFCFDKKRYAEAIEYWQIARNISPNFGTVHRNLGIAYWNIEKDGQKARQSYLKAIECDPNDSLFIFEYDQLRKKIKDSIKERLDFLDQHKKLVLERDDCSVELATLYNQNDMPQATLDLLEGRSFHPWEGGEGKVLRQYTTAHLMLGREDIAKSKFKDALAHFEKAMDTPDSLGEKYHLLQAKADVSYWTGKALAGLGKAEQARQKYLQAANESCDFQEMAVTNYSELTYFKGLALIELDKRNDAIQLFNNMKKWAQEQKKFPAKIDYFATSLPNLLVFDEDINLTKQQSLDKLIKLAESGILQCQ